MIVNPYQFMSIIHNILENEGKTKYIKKVHPRHGTGRLSRKHRDYSKYSPNKCEQKMKGKDNE